MPDAAKGIIAVSLDGSSHDKVFYSIYSVNLITDKYY